MLFRRLFPFAFIFFIISLCLRFSLYGRALMEVPLSFSETLQVFGRGLWFDSVTAFFALIPFVIYSLFLPRQCHGSIVDRRIDAFFRFLFCFVLLFDGIAEHLFWTEFSSRFNFIAVDYLIYTQEVIGNIIESYPIPWLLLGIAVVAFICARLSLWMVPFSRISRFEGPSWKKRVLSTLFYGGLTGGLLAMSHSDQAIIKTNIAATELASNGLYSLFHAFFHNEISYEKFYTTEEKQVVNQKIRTLLKQDNTHFVNAQNDPDLARQIMAIGKELHKNVMIVGMESLSADFMGIFGEPNNLTPNLDRFSKEGLFFANTYATGTRTVRGLEALSLSVPPTPGQSILRRPNNEGLSSLGYLFQDRGYNTKFIYGGYGYFDNMNGFFSENGFGILDRATLKSDEITFANVWGVCDEDMFMKAIQEADQDYKKSVPFLYLIMTTSNHRPFTYPEGRIDQDPQKPLPSRLNGVRYADYSIGKLVEEAKKKPWFKDTVFVFVADHTAGAARKAELDPAKYHIPMIFYAPDLIKPQKIDALVSQIDMAPTLLGLLNMSYNSKFYGQDVLRPSYDPRAFISNYQKVGLVHDNLLTVLAPKRQTEQYVWPTMEIYLEKDQKQIDEAVAYYQSASDWKERQKRIPTIVKVNEVITPAIIPPIDSSPASDHPVDFKKKGL